ncbi:uncharacterized protein LOC143276980 [Babylonia areolata]|uniref:uncharacterized protein LOC143276980 n=1 Tax=Babylonia areolata TaxID=304850 RepID=UPI003FD201E8
MATLGASRITATVCNGLEVLFTILLIQLIANTLCNTSDEFEGFLLCRQCGLEITRADNLLNIPSPLAHRQRNDTLSGTKGVLIQLFKNPHGKYFEIISSKEAEVQRVSKPYAEDSWFPGFMWSVAVCPRCGQQLGWVFEPLPASETIVQMKATQHSGPFFGLILGSLLHEHEAESIIAVPKMYHS